MKKFLFIALLACISGSAGAQMVRANLYGNYVFDDGFNSYYGTYDYYDGTLKGGFQWGAGLEYVVGNRYGMELMYLHQSTTAPTTYQVGIADPIKQVEFDVNMDYILLAGQSLFSNPSGKVEGFGGLMGGVAFIKIEEPSVGREASASKFAWGARVGGNFWASEKIGIKLQAQLLSVAQASGGGFYFGTGGSGVAVSSYSTIYQFILGGGLVFKFGKPQSTEPKPTF